MIVQIAAADATNAVAVVFRSSIFIWTRRDEEYMHHFNFISFRSLECLNGNMTCMLNVEDIIAVKLPTMIMAFNDDSSKTVYNTHS